MNPTRCALLLTALFLTSLAPTAVLNLEKPADARYAAGRATACSADVCLNEVMPNPNGYDDAAWPGGEWMELHNRGNVAVDVLNWTAVNSGGRVLAFNASTIVDYQAGNASSWTLGPGDYMVIARNGDANFYLTNSGMTLQLLNDVGTSVHEATWSTASSGVSYEADSASPTATWVATSSPTPGQPNGGGGSSSGLVPSALVITEVMPNPWPSYDNATWPGGEWVEIANTGTTSLDLTGWRIVDAAGNALEMDADHLVNASSTSIAPGEHRIVAVNGTTPYGVLNNGGETLTLTWPNGSASMRVQWTATQPGMALMDDAQTNGLWGLAPYPTPGDANPDRVDLQPRMHHAVQFSEVLPNATMDGDAYPDGEWVELVNNGSADVDLMGWSIIDGLGNRTDLDPGSIVFNASQGSTALNAGERRLIHFTGPTRLWDNHNHLFLMDNMSVIQDTITYTTDHGENRSLVRADNPLDPWVPSMWNTPGAPEPGTVESSTTVRFSEVLPDAVGADNQAWPLGEWLELENHGTEPVDLSGWRLQASGRTLALHEHNLPFQSTTTVPAGEVALVALNGTSAFYLKHTAPDAISLLDPDGAIVDTIAWNATVEGESLVAPNSTHAGVGLNASQATGHWRLAAWPTPGEVNPSWDAYNGSTALVFTEILPYCNDESIAPASDWFEIHNVGTTAVNLNRWSVQNDDADRRFIREGALWNTTNLDLAPGERAVVQTDTWIVSGLGDRIHLLHPDGGIVHQAMWNLVTDCRTLMDGGNGSWVHTLWPTPGLPEPDPSLVASPEDLKFTRLMPTSSTNLASDLEFIEITNQGNQSAALNGWSLRSITGVDSMYEATITALIVPARSGVVLTNDAAALGVFDSATAVGIDVVLNRSMYLPNGGAALQLLDPTGQSVDTVVYGNGPTEVTGWSGPSLTEPLTGLENLVYLRGDGCSDAPDTDRVEDWHHRWSRLGGSTFCYDTTVSTNGEVVPLIGPESGLLDLLGWVDGATDSLSVHLYQLQDPHLVEAMVNAAGRGVDVTVVLDAGDTWWNNRDLTTQRGMAVTLLEGGVNVLWFGDEGENPYAYLHSKIAVRDNSSVWVGSGNWKSSSLPEPGASGNREWGALIHDVSVATMVNQHLAFDEDPQRHHLVPVATSDRPADWSFPDTDALVGTTAEAVDGAFEAQLLVCPDACIGGLVGLLDNAEREVLLSLQYLDMDWSYGWGENPIITALEDAAARGVRLRLIINGAYLDDGIQSAVDTFNEQWNHTEGYDTAAIVMASDDAVTKLHNKGIIVDDEHVLVSSINWGDSALIRNREMGLVLSSTDLAQAYTEAWWADWNRLDNTTDTDQDGLVDRWEVEFGLERTRRSTGESTDEGMLDPDADGLTNLEEQLHGGDPLNPDTDGDCIVDDLEVAWAQASSLNASRTDVEPRVALTQSDADGNGRIDAEEWGCNLTGVVEQEDNTTVPAETPSTDDDGDGVLNDEDQCPDTPAGEATDLEGCSMAQQQDRAQNVQPSSAEGSQASFMLFLMIGALVLAIGASVVLRRNQSSTDPKDVVELTEQAFDVTDTTSSVAPVLNASQPTVTDSMLARVPGWSESMVREYLLQGWTMDQLTEYYDEQVRLHHDTEQH